MSVLSRCHEKISQRRKRQEELILADGFGRGSLRQHGLMCHRMNQDPLRGTGKGTKNSPMAKKRSDGEGERKVRIGVGVRVRVRVGVGEGEGW